MSETQNDGAEVGDSRRRRTARSRDGGPRPRAGRAADGRPEELRATHAPSEPARRKKGRGPARAAADRTPAPQRDDLRVLLRRPTTQDEIADAVYRLAEGIESGAIRPAQGRLLLDVLELLSAHIERASADAETTAGGGVVRVISGAAIQQGASPTLRTLSCEELEQLSRDFEMHIQNKAAPTAGRPAVDRGNPAPSRAGEEDAA
jgi:hypothetical protein